MTEIFEDEEKINTSEDEIIENDDESWVDLKVEESSDARRRLEDLLDERRLRDELDDYFENEEFI